LAFKHLAVANTFSALDAKVCWDGEEFMEISKKSASPQAHCGGGYPPLPERQEHGLEGQEA
jgi:hypothetical protein